MCGLMMIAVKKNHKIANKINENYCKSIISKLEHRGPDDEGVVIRQNKDTVFALMHRRLSIVDLSSRGHQPMSHDNIDLIYNGEIYNFKEIKKTLEFERGYSFNTGTDTEVLLKAYAEYGVEIFSKLNGMFAFVIFDKNNNKLIIARDRFGIKPLYYTMGKDYFIVASEINPILTDFEKKINANILGEYFRYRFTKGYETYLNQIYEFPTGEYFILDGQL
jgi:asparagine synthase (glutamine-hydrolysing)